MVQGLFEAVHLLEEIRFAKIFQKLEIPTRSYAHVRVRIRV